MIKKLMALATTATMLASNAAAYAIGSAKTVVRGLAGPSAADAYPPGDGRNIQPSIPPMPPEEKAPAHRKVEPRKSRTVKAARQHTVAKPRAKASKSAAKPGNHPKRAAK